MATRDFSKPREPIYFTLDGERFDSTPAIPGGTLAEFATRFSGEDGTDRPPLEQIQAYLSALELVLVPESYDRFHARLSDRERPVELDQAADVILWLLEQYGLRPTQPSSPSSDGQPFPEPGTNLTEPVRPVGVTSGPLPLPVFST